MLSSSSSSFSLFDNDVRLITELSTTSVTSLISCVLAGDMTADNGIPFLSVKIVFLCPVCSYPWDYFRSSPP